MLAKILTSLLIVVLIGASIDHWYTHKTAFKAGYDARIAEESKAAQDAEDQAIKNATTQNKADEISQTYFAITTDQVHSVTFDIQDALHAPEPPHPGEADDQLVPNPFPAAFSLCWRAASTHRAADVAACQAVRRTGAMPGTAAGTTSRYGQTAPADHARPGAGNYQ